MITSLDIKSPKIRSLPQRGNPSSCVHYNVIPVTVLETAWAHWRKYWLLCKTTLSLQEEVNRAFCYNIHEPQKVLHQVQSAKCRAWMWSHWHIESKAVEIIDTESVSMKTGDRGPKVWALEVSDSVSSSSSFSPTIGNPEIRSQTAHLLTARMHMRHRGFSLF